MCGLPLAWGHPLNLYSFSPLDWSNPIFNIPSMIIYVSYTFNLILNISSKDKNNHFCNRLLRVKFITLDPYRKLGAHHLDLGHIEVIQHRRL